MWRVDWCCFLFSCMFREGINWYLRSLAEKQSVSIWYTGTILNRQRENGARSNIPCFKISQSLDQDVEIYGVWRVEVIFVPEGFTGAFCIKGFIKGILKTMVSSSNLGTGTRYHGKNDNPWQVQFRHDRMRQCRFTWSRWTSYTNDTDIGPVSTVMSQWIVDKVWHVSSSRKYKNWVKWDEVLNLSCPTTVLWSHKNESYHGGE